MLQVPSWHLCSSFTYKLPTYFCPWQFWHHPAVWSSAQSRGASLCICSPLHFMRKWGPPWQPLGSTAQALRAAPITLMALHGQREEGWFSAKCCLWRKLFHHPSLGFSSLSSASSGLRPRLCAGGPAGGSWLGCNPSPARRGGPSWSTAGTGFMWHVVFTGNREKYFL